MYYTDDTKGLFLPPSDEWKPVFWTPMKSSVVNLKIKSLGYDIIEFAEEYFTPPRGAGAGEKIKLSESQKWLLIHIFELNEEGYFRYKEVYIQIPRKNSKSLLASIIAAYFVVKGNPGDQIYLAAKDSSQAEIVFKEVKNNIKNSKELSMAVKVNKDLVENKFLDISIKKLTADALKVHGTGPYISICDEVHVWDSETSRSTRAQDLIDALVSGSGDRKESMIIYITTAGSNFDGVAYARYDKGKRIAQGSLEDDTFGFFCWEAEENDPIDDPRTWRKANPGLVAGFLPMETFQATFESAMTMDTTAFERYHLNKWIKHDSSEGYINAFYWDQALDNNLKLEKGARISVGFDGSQNEDSTGFVAIDLDTGLMEVLYKWEKDLSNPNWYVDVQEVNDAMDNIMKDYDVYKVYCDASQYRGEVKSWERKYGSSKVRDIPQSITRMLEMGNDFRTDLYAGTLKQNGDKRFKEHVLNAVTSIKGTAKKDKPGSPNKIDFLICAILANGARRESLKRLEAKRIMAARYQ